MEQFLNPYVTCPYNSAHQVPKLRLQHHIVKCRKNYVKEELKSCPFNATHIVPTLHFGAHLAKCPERRFIEGHKYNALHQEGGDFGNPTFHDTDQAVSSWDDNSNIKEKQSPAKAHQQVPVPCFPNKKKPGALEPILREYEDDNLTDGIETRPPASKLADSPPANKESTPETLPEHTEKRERLGMGRGRVHRVLAKLETA